MMGTYIVLMGVQGAGKGTQAVILKEKLQLPHVSTGDLFRAMKTQETPLAKRVQEIMNAGNLIPDDLTNEIVRERLAQPDAQNGVILDGYPRTPDQARFLDELLKEKGEQITIVPLLQLDHETAVKRAEGRRYSQDKQRTYNIYFNPPKKEGVDDVDGLPLIQRDDDTREGVEQRINLFYTQTQPLIDYYKKQGVVVEIDADQSIEAVSDALLGAVDKHLAR